ncbi:MAG: TonB-dependent receptor [Pseudomonadota bacterium]
MKTLNPYLLATLIGPIATSGPVFAQTAEPLSADPVERQLGTVTVTAQRREQSLIDVPISVKAFTADEIVANDITELSDYVRLTPNIAIDEGGQPGRGNLTIRGIGELGGDQETFGIYLDGFELINTEGRIYDLERIEILRGPQGTTFGRNVIAGAINLTSKVPTQDKQDAYIAVEAGNYGFRDVEAASSFALGETTAARIAGFYSSEDGNLTNLVEDGPGGNDKELFGARLTLASDISSDMSVKALLSYESIERGLFDSVQDGIPIGNVPTLINIIDAGLGQLPSGSIPAGPDSFFPEQNDTVAIDSPTFEEGEVIQLLGTIDYDLGFASVVAIGGYASVDRTNAFDLDQSEFNLAFSNQSFDFSRYSGELRLQSDRNDLINWTIGGIFTRDESSQDFRQFSGEDMEAVTFLPAVVTGAPIDLSLLPNNTLLFGGLSNTEASTYAAFAEAEYSVADRVNLIAGLRLTRNEIEASIADGVDLIDAPGGLLAITEIDDAIDDVSSDDVTWRISAVYEATDNTNIYGTVSTGFRAGGLQLNNTERSDFDSETIINYEIGAKSFLFDRRASINVAAFFMEWDDIQILTINRTNNQSFTDNASKAEAVGIEVDFTVLPFDGLSLSGGIGYVETELSEFDDADDGRIGSPLPNAPELRISIIGDYRRDLFNGVEGFIRGSYIYNDEQITSLIEDGANAPLTLDSYERYDLRLGLRDVNNWSIEAYVENVADDIFATGGSVNGFSLSGARIVSHPQRYGVRFRKTFN